MKETLFAEEEEEEPLEPLRMEHFYFPLLLWTAGMVFSTLSFIAEIIIKPRGGREETEMVE